MTPSIDTVTERGASEDEYARNMLRPDNYALFDAVRNRLNAKPYEPIDSIAAEVGVTVDQLCRWVIGFSEKHRERAQRVPYQSKAFAPIAQPRSKGAGSDWAQSENIRRMKAWKKQRDGARAAREAIEQ